MLQPMTLILVSLVLFYAYQVFPALLLQSCLQIQVSPRHTFFIFVTATRNEAH